MIRGVGTSMQQIVNQGYVPNADATPRHIQGLLIDIKSELGQRQLAEVSRSLPVLILFHLCAAVAVSLVVGAEIPHAVLIGWQLAVLVAAGALGFLAYGSKRNIDKSQKVQHLISLMPFAGLFMAMVWSFPPLVFSRFAELDTNIIIFGVVFAMLGVGVISLLRMPATALLFSSVLATVVSQTMYVYLNGHQVVAAIICLLFGLALNGIIIVMHLSFVRRMQNEWNMNRNTQIIKLLLNDFERDTSDWLWETTREGLLSYASPRLADILGKPVSECLGQDFLQLINLKENALHALMAGRSEIVDHVLDYTRDGRIHYWQITARPLLDDAGQFSGYRGVTRDITSQQDAKLQIQNAKIAAERASAAKSQFLAVMSHELRTPINAIVGFCEVLSASSSESLPPANRNDYLNTVMESARHLEGLINDVLDATRIERGTLLLTDQDIDVAELLEVAIKICRNQVTAANVSIVAHLIEDVTLIGDLMRLKQVALNLLTNAIKFSPPGSVVNIDMKRGSEGELLISIRDAGVGITPEDAERVFEPFVQIDDGHNRRFGGMGLGLSIARRIARMHGGDVTLTGEPHVGSDARLIIPAARVRWPKTKMKAPAMVAA